MKFIAVDTLTKAWLAGTAHLVECPKWTDTTVILHVAMPATMRSAEESTADLVDEFLVGHGQHTHHSVAETIFPAYEYRRNGVAGVYHVYPEDVFPRLRRHKDTRRWGTYAYRLLRRRDADGREYSPLECCIEKMRDKARKRAAYEVGLGFGFDLATYDDDEDRRLRMGGPCLSHLSFKAIGDRVHLSAMYRSHYYMHRAYGNLLGLARLQAFVADQLALQPGTLVCHSTMAVLEHGQHWGWSKDDVDKLLTHCQQAMAEREDESSG